MEINNKKFNPQGIFNFSLTLGAMPQSAGKGTSALRSLSA
jgi:hypothetical protein